jgi:hypothetical protein
MDGFFAAVRAVALAPPAARLCGVVCPEVGMRCPPDGRASRFHLMHVVHSGDVFAVDADDPSYVFQLF